MDVFSFILCQIGLRVNLSIPENPFPSLHLGFSDILIIFGWSGTTLSVWTNCVDVVKTRTFELPDEAESGFFIVTTLEAAGLIICWGLFIRVFGRITFGLTVMFLRFGTGLCDFSEVEALEGLSPPFWLIIFWTLPYKKHNRLELILELKIILEFSNIYI